MGGRCNRSSDKEVVRVRFRLACFAVTAAVLLGTAGLCGAFDIPTGNDDWTWRWDQSFRYTLTDRLLPPDPAILSNMNADDGDRNFGRGIVSNRLDLLTEMDIIYKKNYGVRFSGAAWSDFRYWQAFQNDSPGTYNQIWQGHPTMGLSDFADRYNKGGAELLDAFVFGKLDAGCTPTYWKVGRHMEFWGEALLSPIIGISYAQGPLDLAKATAQPGVQAKEVFRPENNLSFQSQLTPELTFMAQAFFQWERHLAPEDGTYFGNSDLLLKEPGVLYLAKGLWYAHNNDVTPDAVGDFGMGFKWSPPTSLLGGGGETYGIYYRRFSDRFGQAAINTSNNTWFYMYPNDIDLWGISYSGTFKGISVGSELSFRHDMPLVSSVAVVTSNSQIPSSGNTLGARGDTMHALVNALGLLKKSWLWEAGSWNVEMDYSRVLDVTENESVFAGYSSKAWNRVTPDNATITANFSPQWLQVFPGVDISLPLTGTVGLWGVSGVTDGGGQGDGSWGAGLQFDILNKYQVLLNYVSFFGPIDIDPITGFMTKGSYATLKDRDFITLTVKVPF